MNQKTGDSVAVSTPSTQIWVSKNCPLRSNCVPWIMDPRAGQRKYPINPEPLFVPASEEVFIE